MLFNRVNDAEARRVRTEQQLECTTMTLLLGILIGLATSVIGNLITPQVKPWWTAANMLLEFAIPQNRKPELAEDLALAGTTYSSIFPDLDGLTSDLAFQFRLVP